MPELIELTDIVLANEADVGAYLGIKPKSTDYKVYDKMGERAFEFISHELTKSYPNIKKVVSTVRQTVNASTNFWTGVIYDGNEFITGKTYEITNIVDRVGGGDSFMAGFIYGMLNYPTDKEVLEFSLAASALKLTIPGDVNVVSVEEVEQLMRSNTPGRLER